MNTPHRRAKETGLRGILLLKWAVVGLFVLACTVPAQSQLTDIERKGLIDTLYLGNMRIDDLDFERKPFVQPERMPLVDLALDAPLEAADKLMEMHARSNAEPGALLRRLVIDAFGKADAPLVGGNVELASVPADLPSGYRQPVITLVQAIQRANVHVREASKALSPEERRQVIESLPVIAVEQPTITFEFVRQKPLDRTKLFELIGKVDLGRIRSAAAELADAMALPIQQLQAISRQESLVGKRRLEVGRMVVVLAGSGDDIHDERDAMLTIDLGGNDRYVGRHGVGIGYSSVSIDLNGDDTYATPDLSVGAGLLGIGLAYDLGGHDNSRAGSLSFGAGLAGVGIWKKSGGHDRYRTGVLSQGFGMFGIGLSIDTAGDDIYELPLFGQGAARTQGIGWLVDLSGNDAYRAGGLILNSPLFADVNYSFAQGFGMGYREDSGGVSGGVGLLSDLEGKDEYIGETYAQASSYWFSVGSLFDASGHDTYRGHHYVQSSAMHMTSAYLFDLKGDDIYGCNYGATHAIGHDYGLAFMLDRSGNDVYAARDSRPAVGNANGLAIFIDADGEDRYMGPPAVGNPARDSGSLAVFCDLNGPDKYGDGLENGSSSVGSTWAVAMDQATKTFSVDANPTPQAEKAPEPGSIQRPTDAELDNIYRKATQWGVGTAQSEVQQNVNRLIGIGLPAVEWMIANKLKTATRLEVRGFAAVINAVGDRAKNLIALKVASSDDEEARIALAVCIEGRIKEAGPLMVQALGRPSLKRNAARASGIFGDRAAVPALIRLAADPDRLTALNALNSLAQMPDAQAVGTGQALLDSKDLLIRKAALNLVSKFPENAMISARAMISEPDERRARIGVELLGALGTPEALNRAGDLLADSRAGVRIQAMVVLHGRCPVSKRENFVAAKNDPNPLVRSIAQQLDPGR